MTTNPVAPIKSVRSIILMKFIVVRSVSCLVGDSSPNERFLKNSVMKTSAASPSKTNLAITGLNLILYFNTSLTFNGNNDNPLYL
ncbi:hypothetical protein SAMN05518847_101311 [Paenibacillus sp. OV219]|nr:hypothetical protein SAMN05518847_101311 [Paenibacillus sp. OV219]